MPACSHVRTQTKAIVDACVPSQNSRRDFRKRLLLLTFPMNSFMGGFCFDGVFAFDGILSYLHFTGLQRRREGR